MNLHPGFNCTFEIKVNKVCCLPKFTKEPNQKHESRYDKKRWYKKTAYASDKNEMKIIIIKQQREVSLFFVFRLIKRQKNNNSLTTARLAQLSEELGLK